MTEELARKLLEEIREAGLEPYDAFAMGYDTDPQGKPVGLIAFHFVDQATAEEQAVNRERIARTALSVRADRPYSEAVFTVTDRAVRDGFVFFSVDPAGGMPRRLFDALTIRDALFAAC